MNNLDSTTLWCREYGLLAVSWIVTYVAYLARSKIMYEQCIKQFGDVPLNVAEELQALEKGALLKAHNWNCGRLYL